MIFKKSFKTAMLLTALVLAMLGTVTTAAIGAIPYPGGSPTGTFYTSPATYNEGDTIQLVGNFPDSDANKTVTFYGETSTAGQYDVIGTDAANSTGNAYYKTYTVNADRRVFARVSSGGVTPLHTLNPAEVPEPGTGTGTLAPFTASGSYGQTAQAKATFSPAASGATATLQVKLVNPQLEDPPVVTWQNIATAKQSSGGVATFSISDPLEVNHEYRAVSNGVTTNIREFSGQLLTKSTGLPTFHVNTNDGDDVTSRDYYRKGEFAVKSGSGCANAGSVVNVDNSEMEVKGRGNYSWSFPKKSFTLKLDKSTDLCGMGKSKKWALVANDYDKSLMRNATAYALGKRFTNLAWTPDEKPVDVYMNGSFRGSYILVERITADDDTPAEGGRIPVTEFEDPAEDGLSPDQGGYILEWDFRRGAYRNLLVNDRGWVGIKEPEDEAINDARYNYIHSYVEQADNALAKLKSDPNSDDWKSYIDVASAVDYYLAMEYLKPVDGNMWASVYMYKPQGGKLRMGPLWDFDLGAGSANRAGNVVSSSSFYLRNNLQISAMHPENGTPKYDTWFNLLNKSPEFRTAHKNRWNAIQGNLDMRGFISQRKSLISSSASWNFQKWGHSSRISEYQVIKSSWSDDVTYLSGWMNGRRGWLNSQF